MRHKVISIFLLALLAIRPLRVLSIPLLRKGIKKNSKKQEEGETESRPLFCSCISACPESADDFHWYSDSANVEFIGKYELALMNHNDVYRIGDLINQVTADVKKTHWRANMIALLCNSMYRGTILREVLRRTVLIDGLRISPSLSDDDLEALVQTRGEGGRIGYSFGYGLEGENNITLPLRTEAYRSLLRVIQAQDNEIHGESESTLLIPLRMGDERTSLDDFKIFLQDFMSYPRPNLTHALVSGVLHYPSTGNIESYYFSASSLHTNENLIDGVVTELERLNFNVSVSSNPNVDQDIARIIFSPYVLFMNKGRGGLQHLALQIRSDLRGMRFLSMLGTEGSGHDTLTPFVRGVLKHEGVDIGVNMNHDSGAGFPGHSILFDAFRSKRKGVVQHELSMGKPFQVVSHDYSFPTNDYRNTSNSIYDMEFLYDMLHGKVLTSAIITYSRDFDERARYVFRRWPQVCNGKLHGCDGTLKAFDDHIDKEVDTVHKKFGVPVMEISMAQLAINCTDLVNRLSLFLRQAGFFSEVKQRQNAASAGDAALKLCA